MLQDTPSITQLTNCFSSGIDIDIGFGFGFALVLGLGFGLSFCLLDCVLLFEIVMFMLAKTVFPGFRSW